MYLEKNNQKHKFCTFENLKLSSW